MPKSMITHGLGSATEAVSISVGEKRGGQSLELNG